MLVYVGALLIFRFVAASCEDTILFGRALLRFSASAISSGSRVVSAERGIGVRAFICWVNPPVLVYASVAPSGRERYALVDCFVMP